MNEAISDRYWSEAATRVPMSDLGREMITIAPLGCGISVGYGCLFRAAFLGLRIPSVPFQFQREPLRP